MQILDFLSYPFVIKAIIVGICISVSAALIGVILVQKKYSMIGHGLGEAGFASLAIALTLNLNPILVSIPVLIIFSLIIMLISQKKNISGDTIIAMVSTTALATGIILTAINNGFNVDVYGYMFGSILTMSTLDVILSILLSITLTIIYFIFYNRLCLISYDENFAKTSGINVTFYQFLIAVITALIVIVGMRMMGTLLISSLIVFPAITARKITNSFKSLTLVSCIISVITFLIGIIISAMFSLPTGASIVAADVILLFFITILKKIVK